jgi:Protein of unknown function (DUF2975)
MRAFGPGSVSSFLKMALDVVRVALWLGAAIIGPLGLLILIYLPFAPAQLPLDIGGKVFELPLRNPAVAAVLMGMESYLACLLVIVGGIRKVVETLTIGDPFRPENVQRLRVIGLALVALEASATSCALSSPGRRRWPCRIWTAAGSIPPPGSLCLWSLC